MKDQTLLQAKSSTTSKVQINPTNDQFRISSRVNDFLRKWINKEELEEGTIFLDDVSELDYRNSHSLEEAGQLAPKAVVYLDRINDIRYINKFLETINKKLAIGGYFFGCAETAGNRKEKIMERYPKRLNTIVHSLDYLVQRVWPKLPYLKKLYFFLTKGRNRVIAETEVYGRLYSCGFSLLDLQKIENRLYFVVRKIGSPDYNLTPTYGPLIRLNRYGKNNKMIKVYKFRTMHSYSEYIQEYVFEQNGLKAGGKIDNDPRVTTVGHFLRKYWLDELPMLINLIKGDLKLFGVRPISKHYFKLYPEDFQSFRKQFKPGLVPPFYVDLPKTFDEIIESEKKYLGQYEKNPLLTDLKYLFKAFYNILVKRERSS